MAVAYNLDHLQIAPKTATPTYTDVKYIITLGAEISQDSEKLSADASKPVTAYSAPEGAGSFEFGYMDPDTLAIMTGGTTSSSGSGGTLIDRLEIKGNTNPPAVILVGWAPNVDGNSPYAGLRLILPNAKVSVPSGEFSQESFANRTADLVFDPDENGNLMILEFLAAAPTFDVNDVIPTNLEPPA